MMKLYSSFQCLFFVVLVCFAATGCNITSSGDSGASPEIVNLVCDPDEVTIQTAAKIKCTVDFSDPQGDVNVLEVEVYDPYDNPGEPENFDMTEVAGKTDGSFEFQLDLFPSAEGRYTIEAQIVDVEGNSSSTKKVYIDSTL